MLTIAEWRQEFEEEKRRAAERGDAEGVAIAEQRLAKLAEAEKRGVKQSWGMF